MATQDSHQGIKLFGKTIAFNVNNTQKIKKEEDKQLLTEEKRPDKIIACPRCKSMETKFCYFNNYNVKQPRHFCRSCHRYWTAGGALRNVPVGAGRRKSKQHGRVVVGMFGDGNGGHEVEILNGLLVEDWHVEAAAQGGFRRDISLKRPRCCSDGQLC